MSQTFSLVCHKTKQKLWLGQGHNGAMNTFFSGDPETMSRLGRFLEATRGSSLNLVCDDTEGFDLEYWDFEGKEKVR